MATEVLVSTGSPSPQSLVTVAAYSRTVNPHRRRLELGGVLLDQIGLAEAVERIEEFVRSGQPHQIVTVNLDFVSIASRDEAFRQALNVADLAVADGMPLVWLSRLKRQPLAERVAGVELVTESCRVAAELGRGVFLLGAGPGVAEAAGRRLQELNPGLSIAGTYSPPMGPLGPEENERIIHRIQAAAPGFLFVALGAPRQDLWIHDHLPALQVPVAMGVGCVLDLLAGSIKRAPMWMQRGGLEWAFRLGQEPTRLWRRYLLNDLPMLVRLACERSAAEPTEPTEALAVTP
jgi:N-acetylglucosaminyldiphosphoundecaprenol N-acetyl-beta-D-mannosaminyltransferase